MPQFSRQPKASSERKNVQQKNILSLLEPGFLDYFHKLQKRRQNLANAGQNRANSISNEEYEHHSLVDFWIVHFDGFFSSSFIICIYLMITDPFLTKIKFRILGYFSKFSKKYALNSTIFSVFRVPRMRTINRNESSLFSKCMWNTDNLISSLFLLGCREFEPATLFFVFIVHCQLGMPINLQLLVRYLLAGPGRFLLNRGRFT